MTTRLAGAISVLEVDPDLMLHLDPADAAFAASHAMAPLAIVEPSECDPWEWIDTPDGHLGLLVIDGLLTRNVTLLGRTTLELVGSEDLLRPWDDERDYPSVPLTVSWTVHSTARVAVLDRRFAERMAPWPGVATALVSRGLRRAQWLGVHLAILENPRVDVRLLLLMWHLADRWGKVEPDGVTVPLKLTHNVLGRLVRAQRPTVTARLHELAERRLLTRRRDGGWMLHGEPCRQLRLLGPGHESSAGRSSPLPLSLPASRRAV